jgi:hypothetical protein
MERTMILALLALAACGPSRESFPDEFEQRTCEFTIACTDIGADDPATVEECRAADTTDEGLAETLEGNPDLWDAEKAAACLDALDAATESCDQSGITPCLHFF